MTIDLLISADNVAEIENFFTQQGLLVDGEVVEGFTVCLWAGTGKIMVENVTARETLPVSNINGDEISVQLSGQTPWLNEETYLVNANGEMVGMYDRSQGPNNIFLAVAGTTVTQGEQVTVTTPPQFYPGVACLARIYGALYIQDALSPDSGLPPWERSNIAKFLFDNGSQGQGNNGNFDYYGTIDDVRIYDPASVFDWLAANGLPAHEWLGGNRL